MVNFFSAFLCIASVAMLHAIFQTGYGLLCGAQEHLAWNTWIPRRDDIKGISYTILRIFDGFDWYTMITWPDIFKATMVLLRVSEKQLLNSVDSSMHQHRRQQEILSILEDLRFLFSHVECRFDSLGSISA